MAVGDLVLDISSLRSHGDTLYLAGSVVGKILYVGIDGAATGTQIGLIDADPFTMKLMLYPDGGAVGSLVGSPSGGTPQASVLKSACGSIPQFNQTRWSMLLMWR